MTEEDQPSFSVITPVCDPNPKVLREAIESVLSQSYEGWELCLADDASTDHRVRTILAEASAADERVKVVTLEARSGIVAASSAAVGLATGNWLAFLDHDDVLHREALAKVAKAIAGYPDVDYVYTDEDKIDEKGKHFAPFLKPQWSPERLRSQMYTAHLSVMRREVYDAVGGLRAGYDGSQDWDLVLRVTERARRIVHVPEMLYHWRSVAASAASDPNAKPWAFVAGQKAVQSHTDRLGMPVEVVQHTTVPGAMSLTPRFEREPHVTIVVPTRGTRREVRGAEKLLVENCLRGVAERTDYDAWDVVCVADTPYVDQARRDLSFLGERLTVVDYERPFNFSEKINRGAAAARGEYLLLLNDDIEVIDADWLGRLVAQASAPGVGAVGPKLLFEDGRLQHAGIVNREEGPSHYYYELPGHWLGYFGNIAIASNLIGVTAACLLTPKVVFDAVGGMSEEIAVNYNDVDYCFKLWDAGHRIVYAGDVTLFHLEHGTREGSVAPAELDQLWERWPQYRAHDPFLHPGLRFFHADLVPPIVRRKDGVVTRRPDPVTVVRQQGLRGLRLHVDDMLPRPAAAVAKKLFALIRR